MKRLILASSVLASASCLAQTDAVSLLDSLKVEGGAQRDISEAYGMLHQATAEGSEDDDGTVSIGTFYLATQKAGFRTDNLFPVTNPLILIDAVACDWTYVNPLGGALPPGRSSSFGLGIKPGEGYVLLSDRQDCVQKASCSVNVKLADNSTSKTIYIDLLLHQGDCLIEAKRKIRP